MQLDRSQLQQHEQYRLISYSAEASELGIRPGESWPGTLQVTGVGGNGHDFFASEVIRSHAQEFGGIRYRQRFGCLTVTIFND